MLASASVPPTSSTPPRPDLGGLWVPLITPFLSTEAGLVVDHHALARLTQRLVHDGVDGFVVCGTTGEAAALTDDEKLACLATVAAHADGKPLLMGAGGEQWQATCAWLHRLGEVARATCPSLAGVLLTAPHYIRPAQAGVRQWFESLADASRLPVVIYDIPYRTGATLSRDTLLALAGHPNIVGIKDCGGDWGKTLALLADGRLQVLAGEDLAIFSTLAHGGCGAIAASLHLRTPEFVAMRHAMTQGNLPLARSRWFALVPMIEALFAEPNPGPLKAALAWQGACLPDMRPPLSAVSTDTLGQLRAVLA